MRALLYRDWFYGWKTALTVCGMLLSTYVLLLLLIPVTGTIPMTSPFLTVVIGALWFLYSGMVDSNITKSEEKKEWKCYLLASGTGIRTIVAERYLCSFLILFVAYALATTSNLLIFQLLDMPGIVELYSLSNFFYLGFMGFGLLIKAFELPLGYRFGSGQATVFRVLLWLVFLLPLLVYFLFGDIEWLLGEGGFYFSYMDYIESPEALTQAVGAGMEQLSRILFLVLLMIPHLLLLIYYISYRISCRVYQKGVKEHGFREAV